MELLGYDKVEYETNRIVNRIKNEFGIPVGYDLCGEDDINCQTWLKANPSKECRKAIMNVFFKGTPPIKRN